MVYLQETYTKLVKDATNHNFVVIALNYVESNYKIKEYSNENGLLFIPMEINKFDIKNPIVYNLLSLIVMKNLKTKEAKITHKGKSGLEGGKFKNVTPCFGFDQNYKLDHCNAFDYTEPPSNIKRNWSIN